MRITEKIIILIVTVFGCPLHLHCGELSGSNSVEVDKDLLAGLYAMAFSGRMDSAQHLKESEWGNYNAKEAVRIAFSYWLNAHSEYSIHSSYPQVDGVMPPLLKRYFGADSDHGGGRSLLEDPLLLLERYEEGILPLREKRLLDLFNGIPISEEAYTEKNRYLNLVEEFRAWING